LHHVVVERWSRLDSFLHKLDARVKFVTLLVFLIAVSTTPVRAQLAFAAYAVLLASAAIASRLPLGGLLSRAAFVLPFTGTFALMTWWAGNPDRALALVEKSFLSGFAALLLIGTSPLTKLVAGLDSLGAPRALLLVIQFLYRYLFVISEEAQHMRMAASSRMGSTRQIAAGTVGVLFARSSERAEGIYQAMLARGFQGHYPMAAPPKIMPRDGIFFVSTVAFCVAIRLAL
jgi:cobalt/nickel transport system permease protein